MMRAVVVEKFGPIDSHSVGELPSPSLRANEVLVSIKACAVNFVDLLVINGKYQFLPNRPFAPGKLPVGVATKTGPGVDQVSVGERVLTLAEHGGYAEEIAVPVSQCFRLPNSMSFTDAAAITLSYDTAWFALRERGRLQAGESVLVLGASGAVGRASIQIAKSMGARVFAGLSDPKKLEVSRDHSVEGVIDLSRPDLYNSLREQVYAQNNGVGVDLVIDPVGGDAFDAALRALAWCGRIVIVGFASGRISLIKANYLLLKNIEASGLQISDYRNKKPELMAKCINDIFQLYDDGKLRVPATTTYKLDQFKTAMHEIENRTAPNRLVLLPNG